MGWDGTPPRERAAAAGARRPSLVMIRAFAAAAITLAVYLYPPAPASQQATALPTSDAATRRAGCLGRAEAIEAARAGRWQEARTALEQALKAEPGQPEALYALVVCLGQLGDAPAALRDLAGALKAGFQDYRALDADPGLKPLRTL